MNNIFSLICSSLTYLLPVFLAILSFSLSLSSSQSPCSLLFARPGTSDRVREIYHTWMRKHGLVERIKNLTHRGVSLGSWLKDRAQTGPNITSSTLSRFPSTRYSPPPPHQSTAVSCCITKTTTTIKSNKTQNDAHHTIKMPVLRA